MCKVSYKKQIFFSHAMTKKHPKDQQITKDEMDTLGTYADTATGYFMFQGVNEGTYNLELKPNDEYLDTTLNDVNVMTGQVTSLDTINLESIQ